MQIRPLNLDEISRHTIQKELRHPPLPPKKLGDPAEWQRYIDVLEFHLNQGEQMSKWEKDRWHMALNDAKRMHSCLNLLRKPLPDIAQIKGA